MAAPGGAMKGTLESPPAPTPLREPCSCSRESPGTPRDSKSAMMSGSFWTLAAIASSANSSFGLRRGRRSPSAVAAVTLARPAVRAAGGAAGQGEAKKAAHGMRERLEPGSRKVGRSGAGSGGVRQAAS